MFFLVWGGGPDSGFKVIDTSEDLQGYLGLGVL